MTMTKARLRGALTEELTRREVHTLDLLVLGLSNQEIADRMGVKLKTVDQHLMNIKDKTGLSNRVKLALWWAYGD